VNDYASAPRQPVVYFGGMTLAPKDHVCGFYRGRAERDRLLFPFLSDGLMCGQPCIYFAAEDERTDVAERVRNDCSGGIDPALFEVHEPEGGYLRSGEFAPSPLLEGLTAWADGHISSGDAEFARIIGDMSWAGPMLSPGLISQLFHSEVAMTGWVHLRPQIVAVCLYDLDLFSGDLIIPMVKAHPKVWMNGAMIENPYYMAPSRPDEAGGSSSGGKSQHHIE
jgi:hypothetical protein